MRILMLHNSYLVRGGEDEATHAEVALLQSFHHDVTLFEVSNQTIAEKSLLATAVETIWSADSYSNLRKILGRKKFDIVHVQNFFPLLSPSVFYAAAAESVPVIQALHNYRLLCVNGLFYRGTGVCEDCAKAKSNLPGIVHRCYRNSMAGSAVVATMLDTHKMIGTWNNKIIEYYTVSEFARNKFVEYGMPASKISVKPNFVNPPSYPSNKSEKNCAVFIGRLSPEKGIETMLEAWDKLHSNVKLKIVGDGPLFDYVKSKAKMNERIELVGKVDHAKIFDILHEAYFLIFPSICYETFGMTVIEAFSCGVPVIGSGNGAAKELIVDQVTGWHFDPYSADDLAAKVEYAWAHPEQTSVMGFNARKTYEEKYTPNRNYEMLMRMYERVIVSSTA